MPQNCLMDYCYNYSNINCVLKVIPFESYDECHAKIDLFEVKKIG